MAQRRWSAAWSQRHCVTLEPCRQTGVLATVSTPYSTRAAPCLLSAASFDPGDKRADAGVRTGFDTAFGACGWSPILTTSRPRHERRYGPSAPGVLRSRMTIRA
jgi:hypothetical protein